MYMWNKISQDYHKDITHFEEVLRYYINDRRRPVAQQMSLLFPSLEFGEAQEIRQKIL